MRHQVHIPPLAIAFALAGLAHAGLLLVSLEAFGRSDHQIPRPDLAVASVVADAQAAAGDILQVQAAVENRGGVGLDAYQARVLLSRDRIIDEQDIELARRPGKPLRPQASRAETFVGLVPDDADGPYALLVEAALLINTSGNATDANPDNNTRSASIFIDGPQRPELAVDQLAAPPRGIIGSKIVVDYAVTNRGPGWAPAGWTDRVYLSTDDQLDPGDTPLRDFARERHLGPEQSYTYDRVEINLPPVEPGQYHLIAVADDGQVLDQPSFTAGLAARPIQITRSDRPDLVVTDIQATPRIVVGEPAAMRFTVANLGVVDTPADTIWADHVYLSRDQTINRQDDIYLGSAQALRPLAAGRRYLNDTHQFTIPEDTEPGEWYLAVVADGGETVDEGAFEENNAWAIPIHVLSRAQAEDEPPLGEPDEADRLTIAWIEHEVLLEHMARKRSTIQPAIQAIAEPDPNAPSIPDPLPPSQAGIARQPAGDPNTPRQQIDPQQQSSPRPQPSVPDQTESDIAPRPQAPNTPSPEQVDGIEGDRGQTPRNQEGADTPQPSDNEQETNPTPDRQNQRRNTPGRRDVEPPAEPNAPETDRQTDSDTPAEQDADTDGGNPEENDSDQDAQTPDDTEGQTPTDNDTTQPSEADGEGDSDKETQQTETTDTPAEEDADRDPGEQSDPSRQNPEQSPTRREREDAEADETDINEPLRYQEGGVLVGRGIKIKTRRLRPPGAGTRFTTVPHDAAVRIVFNNEGQVVDAQITSSTGYRDWDALILESLYRWTAEGERIDAAAPYVEILMEYKFGLLSGLR